MNEQAGVIIVTFQAEKRFFSNPARQAQAVSP